MYFKWLLYSNKLSLIDVVLMFFQTELLHYCTEETFKQLKTIWAREAAPKYKVAINGATYQYINYDILRRPVSVHYPLTRFAAGLLVQRGRLDMPLNTPLISSCILELTERSFRTLALWAQVGAGAWRRNGLGLQQQAFYTRHHHCRTESFDRDLQLLQACASLVDPDLFCHVLERKFNLLDSDRFEEVRFLVGEVLHF